MGIIGAVCIGSMTAAEMDMSEVKCAEVQGDAALDDASGFDGAIGDSSHVDGGVGVVLGAGDSALVDGLQPFCRHMLKEAIFMIGRVQQTD